jgi:hypothetical protein
VLGHFSKNINWALLKKSIKISKDPSYGWLLLLVKLSPFQAKQLAKN